MTAEPSVPGRPRRPARAADRRPARLDSPGRALAVHRIRLGIHSADPLSRAGLMLHVSRRPDIEVLPESTPTEATAADVLVFVATALDAHLMEQLHAAHATAKPRLVLILERLGHPDLLSAIEFGVSAVLWRHEVTAERFIQTLLTVRAGGGELPPEVQGRLVAEVARLQRTVLSPRGLTASGLDAREVDVLRLIADGLDTAEIAERIAYSERTVKAILYGMMSRLMLRNRSHAVAFAIRAGVL